MLFGLFGKKPEKPKATLQTKPPENEEVIGDVTHYFPHCKACVIRLTAPVIIGDKVHIKGHTTDFVQEITSLQINGKPITSAKKGDEIGLLVKDRVRTTDTVYKITR